MVAGTLASIEWTDSCLIPPGPPLAPDVEKKIKKEMGYVPEYITGFSLVPWLLDNVLDLGHLPSVHVSYALSDLVGLVVGQESSCRYCYGISRSLLQLSGMSEAKIRQLEQELHAADLAAQDKAALDFARKIARANPRPGANEHKSLAEQGWSDTEIAEIATAAAASVFMNRLMTMAAARPAPIENFTHGWRALVFKPMIKMSLRKRKPADPVAPLTDVSEKPYGAIVELAQGLPGSLILARMVEGAFTSAILPVRTKAFVFAVVARTLECDACETEARRILSAEGVDAATVDEALAHLASPGLTEIEAKAIPVARSTVRGQPAEIQAKVKGLRDQLAPEQFVEFVAVAALANTFSRLSCLMYRC